MTATLTTPSTNTGRAPASAENASAQGARRRAHVVLVDDERELTRGLAILLRAAGFEVTTAASGLQGLTAISQTHPDVILLDIRMPDIDGLAVLSKVRAQHDTADTPVVMLSASLGEQTGKRALDLGAQFIVEKPYELKNLLAAMQAAMRTKGKNSIPAGQSTSVARPM